MAREKPKKIKRYAQIIEQIFLARYRKGLAQIPFERTDIEKASTKLGIKNLGDLIYSFRYRAILPESVRKRAPEGHEWIIRPAGRAKYCFVAIKSAPIIPNQMMSKTKVPDATPGIIMKYALTDEQALLAKLRYNRLIDIFTGVTCYPLQSHLRTQVEKFGQIETDEVYIGVDQRGVHYVFPVQAKGARDRLNIVQIEQDFEMCAEKFPALICRAIGAQFIESDLIALFAFQKTGDNLPSIVLEKHYRLVPHSELSSDEIRAYQSESSNQNIL